MDQLSIEDLKDLCASSGFPEEEWVDKGEKSDLIKYMNEKLK